MKTMAAMIPVLAEAFGVPERSQRERHRQYRLRQQIFGLGRKGRGVEPATIRELATVVIGHLSGNHPLSAADDLALSLGLVLAQVFDGPRLMAGLEGMRGTPLVTAVAAHLSELVESGRVDGVKDMTIRVWRPWPAALMHFVREDNSVLSFIFHHEVAKSTGSPERDEIQIEALTQLWGYIPGSEQSSSIGLAGLKTIADAYAGRPRVAPREIAPEPEMGAPRLW